MSMVTIYMKKKAPIHYRLPKDEAMKFYNELFEAVDTMSIDPLVTVVTGSITFSFRQGELDAVSIDTEEDWSEYHIQQAAEDLVRNQFIQERANKLYAEKSAAQREANEVGRKS